MRKSLLILPVALGTIFSAFFSAQARPVYPGLVMSGQTEAQARAAVAEVRETYPNAEVVVGYDWGRRSFTVEVKPRDTANPGGGGDAGGEGGAD